MQSQDSKLKPTAQARAALQVGCLAAILASTCCLGPLILILLGFSGAWIGNLTALEPYRPFFIVAALAALFFAWRRIWCPTADCQTGRRCALPQVRRSYQFFFGLVVFLVLISFAFPYFAFFFY